MGGREGSRRREGGRERQREGGRDRQREGGKEREGRIVLDIRNSGKAHNSK